MSEITKKDGMTIFKTDSRIDTSCGHWYLTKVRSN